MTAVADILAHLQTIAPESMKMDWDNVGLLCGRRDKAVRRVLVALDPFWGVCQEAAQRGADMILTHHPLIFRPVNSVTEDTAPGKCILFLAAHDIAAVNAHTNLDCAPGGVNDRLAACLGLNGVTVIQPTGVDSQGRPWGLLRMGRVDRSPLSGFLARVQAALGCPGLRYVDAGRPVHLVAVGGGACAGELPTVKEAGCDTFVTADVKYNQFWDARELGINLIDAGHFWTENPVCQVLRDSVQAAFPELTVEISQVHRDCAQFFSNHPTQI